MWVLLCFWIADASHSMLCVVISQESIWQYSAAIPLNLLWILKGSYIYSNTWQTLFDISVTFDACMMHKINCDIITVNIIVRINSKTLLEISESYCKCDFSFRISDLWESNFGVVDTLLCYRCWFLLRDAVTVRSPDPGIFPETPSWSVSHQSLSSLNLSLSLLFFYHLVPVCYLSVCVCAKGMMDVSFMTVLNVVWANLSWDEDPAGVL